MSLPCAAPIALLTLLASACAVDSADGGDTDAATSGSTGASSSGVDSTNPMTADSGDDTGSMTAAETTATTMPPTLPTSDSSGGADDGASSDSTGDGEGSGSTGEADVCPSLGRDACVADPECTPIVCGPFEMPDAGAVPWCIAPDQFIGCRAADKGCAQVRTVACEGDDGPAHLCPTACIPEGWTTCPSPMMGAMPCPE